MAILLSLAILPGGVKAEGSGVPEGRGDSLDYTAADSYRAYLENHSGDARGADDLLLGADALSAHSENVTTQENLGGRPGASLLTGEEGYVTYRFAVASAGLYNIGLHYYPLEGKGSSMIRTFEVDGSVPFAELREIDFPRIWRDKEPIGQDSNGNDTRPAQEEAPRWLYTDLHDSTGYYNEPLQVYLSAGEHTLTIFSEREPMAVGGVRIYSAPQPAPYAEALESYRRQGLADAREFCRDYQGEQADYKSASSIYPIYDRTSPDTVPTSASQIRLNTIGGSKWQVAGQWLIWEVEVPADGLYTLGIKGRQNVVNGAYSSRRLYVNGEIPYKEAEEIRFHYDNSFQTQVFGDGETAYRIPLKKGINEIKLEATLGSLSSLLMEVDDCIAALNSIYMKILMITGPTPDQLRDYQFDKQIPDVLRNLKEQADALEDLYSRYVAITGQNGQEAQTLKKAYLQAREMTDDPDGIAQRFSTFSSNITELGTWLSNAAQQPLEIDYLTVASPDQSLVKKGAGFFSRFWFGVKQLVASFLHDYDVVGAIDGTGRNVRVWVGNGATGGRDQVQVLQRMASASFTKDTGIAVQIQLISTGALLPATLSGKGPDVALTLNASDPINYAVRHGVINLAAFSDYVQVAERFMPSALEPFSFDGGVYALPETQTFYMLFYRKDILAELGLEVPNTWEDVIHILPVLQKKNLNFGFPKVLVDGAVGLGLPVYATFLFQNGGSLYTANGSKTLLDSKEAVNAFFEWTKFYTSYGLPTQYDFLNRFRSGAVPIGIEEYSNYNTLQVFAPEIKGKWGFAAIPGTPREDGTLDRSSCGTTTGCSILNTVKDKDAAWAFLKWWTSADVQGDFGVELENILGAAGRYCPANREALERIPWSQENLKTIQAQWSEVKGIREVPGSYMTSRFVDFAFRDAVSSGVDPDEALRDAVKQMNAEIKLRRKEFGLAEE